MYIYIRLCTFIAHTCRGGLGWGAPKKPHANSKRCCYQTALLRLHLALNEREAVHSRAQATLPSGCCVCQCFPLDACVCVCVCLCVCVYGCTA